MLNDYYPYVVRAIAKGKQLSKVDRAWYNYNDITESSQETINRMSYAAYKFWINIPKEPLELSYAIVKNSFKYI